MKVNIIYAQRLEHCKDLCVSKTGLDKFSFVWWGRNTHIHSDFNYSDIRNLFYLSELNEAHSSFIKKYAFSNSSSNFLHVNWCTHSRLQHIYPLGLL